MFLEIVKMVLTGALNAKLHLPGDLTFEDIFKSVSGLRNLRCEYLANYYFLDLRGTSLICEVCNEEHSTKYCLSYNVSDRLLYLFLSVGTAFRTT